MSQVSVTGSSEGSEWLSSPGQNKHLAPVFTSVTAHPDVEAGLFSSYSGSESLPWHVSAGCCPRPANRRTEGNTQEESEHCGGTCGGLCSCLCRCWQLLFVSLCCDTVLGYQRTASSHSRPGVNMWCPCWYLFSAQSHVLPYKLWKCLGVNRCDWPERLRLTSDNISFFPAVPHHLLTGSAPSMSLTSFEEEASEGPHCWEPLIRWQMAPVGVCCFP